MIRIRHRRLTRIGAGVPGARRMPTWLDAATSFALGALTTLALLAYGGRL